MVVVVVVVGVEDWFEVVVKCAVNFRVVGCWNALARLEQDSGTACWWAPGVSEEGLVPFLFVVVLLFLFATSLCGVLFVVVVGFVGVFVHDVVDGGPVEVGRWVRVVVVEEAAQSFL